MTEDICCGGCGYPVHQTKAAACDWCRQTADRIEALTEQLEAARLDAREAEAYSVWLERELAKVAAAFHANFIVKSDTHAHKAFGAGIAELKGDKT